MRGVRECIIGSATSETVSRLLSWNQEVLHVC